MANHHRVSLLLYRHLNSTDAAWVPEPVLQQLKTTFWRNARRNMLLTSRLLDLLKLLEDHNIPAVPFKGPVLTSMVYGNLALRYIGDLDIVIHQRHACYVRDLLLAHGYALPDTPTPRLQALTLKHHHHYRFVSHRLSVEIHWAFAQRIHNIPITLDTLTSYLSTTDLGGRQVAVLVPEYLVVLLCVHGMRHYWERLSWVSDIAWLQEAYPHLNWAQVLEFSDQFGIRRIVLLGVFLAHHLLGSTLPPEIMQAIMADRTILVLASSIENRLMTTRSKPPGKNKDLLFLMSRERLQDKTMYVWQRLHWTLKTVWLLNDRDFAFISLPDWLSPLYYLIRPIRIMYDYRRLFSQYRND